ncbi:hypothetical protein F5X68DRAFT_24597 [Plectosphaerella plurivora]|uniref:F-box domain-containing protein n=1 Tax=Plectosphaerella plurivora TaxID=936078 RepID=A0A9P8V8A2_9PEZI|nr:hypothetical protein F5X68DRAFT_24597 [Plectosphaerella plurivora]
MDCGRCFIRHSWARHTSKATSRPLFHMRLAPQPRKQHQLILIHHLHHSPAMDLPNTSPRRQLLDKPPPEPATNKSATEDPPRSPFPLLDLLPELLICIFQCLDNVDAICLGLCNKLLYDLGPDAFDRHFLVGPQSLDLGRRLERDLVDTHVYCYECDKLEPYTARSLRTGEPHPVLKVCDDNDDNDDGETFYRRCEKLAVLSTTDWWRGGLDFGYHLVRFVLNQYHVRQELGDITLDVFRGDHRRTESRGARLGEWDVSVEARLIDDELYLHKTHTAMIRRGALIDLIDGDFFYPEDCSFPDVARAHRVCLHKTAAKLYDAQYLREANRGIDTNTYLRTSSCWHCLSDFTFEGRPDGDYHVFTIRGFHALGNFKDDWIRIGWKFTCFTSGREDLLGAHYRTPATDDMWDTLPGEEYPFGSIRMAWVNSERQELA